MKKLQANQRSEENTQSSQQGLESTSHKIVFTEDSRSLENYSELNKKVTDIREELWQDLTSARKDYVAIFGIFAAIITFLGIEVQGFNKIDSFSKLVGFSLFLISCVLLLLFGVQQISAQKSELSYKSPLIILSIISILLSFVFFWYHISGKVLIWSI